MVYDLPLKCLTLCREGHLVLHPVIGKLGFEAMSAIPIPLAQLAQDNCEGPISCQCWYFITKNLALYPFKAPNNPKQNQREVRVEKNLRIGSYFLYSISLAMPILLSFVFGLLRCPFLLAHSYLHCFGPSQAAKVLYPINGHSYLPPKGAQEILQPLVWFVIFKCLKYATIWWRSEGDFSFNETTSSAIFKFHCDWVAMGRCDLDDL